MKLNRRSFIKGSGATLAGGLTASAPAMTATAAPLNGAYGSGAYGAALYGGRTIPTAVEYTQTATESVSQRGIWSTVAAAGLAGLVTLRLRRPSDEA